MTPHQILALLPHAFQASEEQSDTPTPLATLLSVMEVMHGPTEVDPRAIHRALCGIDCARAAPCPARKLAARSATSDP